MVLRTVKVAIAQFRQRERELGPLLLITPSATFLRTDSDYFTLLTSTHKQLNHSQITHQFSNRKEMANLPPAPMPTAAPAHLFKPPNKAELSVCKAPSVPASR
jgi:hypothetical protein